MTRQAQVSLGGSVLLVLMLLILAVPGLRCLTRAFSRWGAQLLPLQSMGSRHAGSGVVAPGLSCPAAHGIFTPGTEPGSSAPPGRFSTPGPPGKSLDQLLMLERFCVVDRHLGVMGKTDTECKGPGWRPDSFT